MNYSDYKVLAEREYKRNRKHIYTCYFFLALSAVFFAMFFVSVRELPVIGAAFFLDLAAGMYAVRAFKGIHPYWEMQLALKAKENPSEAAVCSFAAGVEYALEQALPAFKGRAPEIFEETLAAVRKSGEVSAEDVARLESVLKRAVPDRE